MYVYCLIIFSLVSLLRKKNYLLKLKIITCTDHPIIEILGLVLQTGCLSHII